MKGMLAEAIPPLRRLAWEGRWYGLSRDRAYRFFVVLNLVLLGVETTLAHLSNGTLRPYEWIPMIFGPVAGVTVLLTIAGQRRAPRWTTRVFRLVMVLSILVGLGGTYLHLARSLRLTAPPGTRFNLSHLVWGLPLLAPPSFALVGALGLATYANAHGERKDRTYFLLTCIGVLIAGVSSTLDHLRGGFENPWLWIPATTGIFGTVVAFVVGVLRERTRGDILIYAATMVVLASVGLLGLVLHVVFDLGPGRTLVVERLLRQAPVLAPMVFANFGLMGLIALLDGSD